MDKIIVLKTQESQENLREKIQRNQIQNFYSARYETRDITYQNRIFNIKKKFTVPNYHNDFYRERKTQISKNINHPKPSEMFCKHLDNIIKNRRLLRRNIWELPFKAQCVVEEEKGKNRYKTEAEEQSKQKQKIIDIVNNRKRVAESTRKFSQQRQKKHFPVLRNSQHEIQLPIKLQTRYGSKSISSKITDADEQTLKINAISRKLAVELINYNLLGKWASSSLKNN